jgi:hypothetical protein
VAATERPTDADERDAPEPGQSCADGESLTDDTTSPAESAVACRPSETTRQAAGRRATDRTSAEQQGTAPIGEPGAVPNQPPIKPWSGATTWPAREQPVGRGRRAVPPPAPGFARPPGNAMPRKTLPRRPRDLRSRWAAWLAFGAVACTLLSIAIGLDTFPTWLVGAGTGLVCAVAALIIGALVSIDANKTRTRAPEATVSMIVSALVGLLALCLVGLSIVEFGPLRDYASCMGGANTISAQDQCAQDFANRVGTPVLSVPHSR